MLLTQRAAEARDTSRAYHLQLQHLHVHSVLPFSCRHSSHCTSFNPLADMSGKDFTFSDVSEHTGKKDIYIVVHDKVYDATSFVDEHPYVLPWHSAKLASVSTS